MATPKRKEDGGGEGEEKKEKGEPFFQCLLSAATLRLPGRMRPGVLDGEEKKKKGKRRKEGERRGSARFLF